MGLKPIAFVLTVLTLLAGCGEAPSSGQTLHVEGANRPIPPITQAFSAVHLRTVGAEQVYRLHLPASVRTLSLIDNRLMALPEGLIPKTIERLWLSENRLTHLPHDLQDWQQLTYLNLDRNLLMLLPPLGHTRLRWLRANGNRLSHLSELPETLERLYLADNRLTSVPPKPTALRHLTLAGNPLTTVPDSLGEGLEWLDLSRTQLTALPQDLSAWQTLKVLNLARCPLPEDEKARIQEAFDPDDTLLLF